MIHDRRRPAAFRSRHTSFLGSLCLMILFGGAIVLGPQPTYATDWTVATWSELTDAFENAPDGDTVVLSGNITQMSDTLNLPSGKDLTLNLNGHALSITASLAGTGAPGLRVPADSSLTIEDSAGGGILNATGTSFGAGIGEDLYQTAGTVTINGGTVIAVGGSGGGAGIGGGYDGSGGTVIINDGTVNATGSYVGAGIGGSFSGSGGTVTITGGTVIATSNGGAGIGGGGMRGPGGTVTITGGTVNATSNGGGAGIGGGMGGDGGTVVITEGVVTPSAGNASNVSAIGPGMSAEEPSFFSLSNGGTIVLPSGQKLIIPSGVTLENSGTIEGEGSIEGNGIVVNSGTIKSIVSGITVNGNAYDLTFDLGDAPGTPPSSLHIMALTVQKAGLSLESPNPAGYEFDGWYTFDGVHFTDTTPISSITSTGSATLYAHWKYIEIEVVAPLSDIHVPYGTELSDVELPTMVDVTLSSGDTEPAAVAWDGGAPAYEGNTPGTYVFTGTLTAPAGSTNPDGKTASVNLIVEEPTVESVGALPDIHVPYGTESSDVELPTTVDVTLSSGDTKPAVVVWDGGAPAYDSTTPGTYVFTGTLTAPAGSTNPDGKTASVNVLVEEPTVESVGALPDIHVPYGTELSDVELPTTVDVTLSSGDTKSAVVVWDEGAPAYDGTTPDTYVFTGTLTAPAGSTNPDGKTASVNVIVEEPTVESVSALPDIHVPYGTELSDVELPTTADVTLSNGDTKPAAVAWDGGTPTYDDNTPGTYAFTGTLTAPAGSTNPDGKTASVNVIVEEPTVESVSALPDIHVPYGTELSDVELPTTVDVTLSSGDTKPAAVAWDGGTPTYDDDTPGTYAFTGTLTAPVGSTNPDGKTASVNVIVEEPTVESVGALPDIHVPYGTELSDVELPTTVDVTLSSGDTKSAVVVWDEGAPAYDGTTPDTYVFTGTLTAPAGSTNPDGKTASVNVIVEEPTVESVSALPDIHVPYGTELSDVELPTTVDVTLSSGDTKSAAVVWDEGAPAYDGTTPDTYVFTGTLTAPVGSTNPDGKAASVNVVVAQPTVTSVGALADIHVPYGTPLTSIVLPTTVDVALSSGETKPATVTWDGGVPTYDGDTPGTYVFTGTLTAPGGSTNPDGKTASVDVVVAQPTVTSVGALADIHVPYGTELSDVELPTTVDVTLSSRDTKSAAVTWDGGVPTYDGMEPDTYVFTGTLTAPAGSTNPDNKTASVNVIVGQPAVTSVSTLPDIHVPYGTLLTGIGLPTTADVELSSGETKSATVAWDGGTSAYDGNTPGTYVFTGTLTAPGGSTNPDGKTASVNVIVDEPTVTAVGALSDVHVPYGTLLTGIGLPTTADVELSSGETKSATVAWDGGTPAYDGNTPGTYVFTGTLTAPVGSTNPDGKTASVNVIVEEPTVTSVSALADIRVPYGTLLTGIGLPTTVDVTLSSGDTKTATVAWDGGDPAYNGKKSGKYEFTGTLTPPAGTVNPDGRTASVNVIVNHAPDSTPTPAPDPQTRVTVYCETDVCTASLGDQVMVSIPAKAADRRFSLTLEMLGTDEAQLPDGAQWLSKVFRLNKSIEEPLQLPMTLQIKLESAKIGDDRRAALFFYDEPTDQWTEVNGSLIGDVFTAQTDKFADFAVLSVAEQTAPPPSQPDEPAIHLSDISGHWAETVIEAAVAKGIVTGYQDGTFHPSQQVSRVEFTAMLNRALKLTGSGGAGESPEPAFADAASIPAWARSSVAEATAQGLIQGFPDGTFRPGELMSRAELAAIAARALHLAEAPETRHSFADANDIPSWAREAVAAVQQAGIMKGVGGNRFAPNALVTRAEAAVLIFRMIEQLQ